MRLAGPLTDRLGARKVLPVSAALCGAAVLLPGLAGDAPALGAALLLLGFGNGTLDVSMNAHAVQVERRYGRPLMSAFHAAFSVGGVLAALAGALALGRGWSPATTLGVTAAGGLVVTALAARLLLPHAPTSPDPTATATATATSTASPGGSGSWPVSPSSSCSARASPTTGAPRTSRTSSARPPVPRPSPTGPSRPP